MLLFITIEDNGKLIHSDLWHWEINMQIPTITVRLQPGDFLNFAEILASTLYYVIPTMFFKNPNMAIKQNSIFRIYNSG